MASHEIRIITRKPKVMAVKQASDSMTKARVQNHRERLFANVQPGQNKAKTLPLPPQGAEVVGQIWRSKENEEDEVVILQDLGLCLLVTQIKLLEAAQFAETWAVTKAALHEKYNLTEENLTIKP